jgi:hypothetical protein
MNGLTADEWFSDYLHRVQTAGRKKQKALAERLPMPRDRDLVWEREYDATTDRLLGQIRERTTP